jgi:resuscitation-promoting factor RpfB
MRGGGARRSRGAIPRAPAEERAAGVRRCLVRIIARGALGCAVALGSCAPGRAATFADHGPAGQRDPAVVDRNRVLAVALMTPLGWSDRQWTCLDRLWRRESHWNHRARNHESGAYGIPQALPAGKMASAGTDWRTSPVTQIRWGLTYIARRYGTPCAALGHSAAAGWY